MNVRIFWVRAMKCMCAQTRPRFILSSERVLGGMEFEPMLTPREKSPLPENVPRGGSNPRHRGQRAHALPTELFRPLFVLLNLSAFFSSPFFVCGENPSCYFPSMWHKWKVWPVNRWYTWLALMFKCGVNCEAVRGTIRPCLQRMMVHELPFFHWMVCRTFNFFCSWCRILPVVVHMTLCLVIHSWS